MGKSSKDVSYYERLFWLLNTLFHQALAVVTIFILWQLLSVYKWDSNFTIHVVFATVAYVPLMVEAMIVFSSDNVWSQYMDRTRKYWIHGLLLTISFVFLTLGIFIETYQKNKYPNPKHFTSMHAMTGLASWVLIVVTLLPGILGFQSISLGIIKPVVFKFVHNLIGIFGYVLGMVSLAYGLYTRSFKFISTEDSRLVTVWTLGIITLWSLIAPFKSGYNQLKTIFNKS